MSRTQTREAPATPYATRSVSNRMSDAASKPMTELKVTAHLMRLDMGTFCIVQTPGTRHDPDPAGLPGVRIAVPPDAPPGVTIASFRADGWLSGQTDAAIVRVTEPGAQLLITVYQNIGSADPAPRLQVIRLGEEAQAAGPRAVAAARAPVPLQPRSRPEMVAHQQVKGDIGAMLGEWIGDRGSKRWIEGFMIVRTPASRRPTSNIRRCSAAAGCRPGPKAAACAAAAACRCRS
jgi:hypothetical protein